MKDGWTIIKREILYDDFVMKDAYHLAVYTYLLLNAQVCKGVKDGIELNEGEVLFSQRELASKLEIERKKIQFILKDLEKGARICATKKYGKTLAVVRDFGDFSFQKEPLFAPQMRHFCATMQETKDEKEKRSKREKEESKEIIKKEKTPYKSPKGTVKASGEELFEEFWALYPRKVGKADARRKFARLNVDSILFEKIKATLNWQRKSDDWTQENGKYIPYPATWLNHGRWDDESFDSITDEAKNYSFGDYI